MQTYKLELKQIVDYPRCRMCRDFIHSLIKNKDIRLTGTCGLYYYLVLCCHANFRTSYNRIKGFTYTVFPGEWICTIGELTEWFRTGTKRKTIAVMENLQERQLLKCKLLGKGTLVKYRIANWSVRVVFHAPPLREMRSSTTIREKIK